MHILQTSSTCSTASSHTCRKQSCSLARMTKRLEMPTLMSRMSVKLTWSTTSNPACAVARGCLGQKRAALHPQGHWLDGDSTGARYDWICRSDDPSLMLRWHARRAPALRSKHVERTTAVAAGCTRAACVARSLQGLDWGCRLWRTGPRVEDAGSWTGEGGGTHRRAPCALRRYLAVGLQTFMA